MALMEVEMLIGFTIQIVVSIVGLVLIALMLVYEARLLARMDRKMEGTNQKMEADDAAIYLTQKQIQAALKDMRELLKGTT